MTSLRLVQLEAVSEHIYGLLAPATHSGAALRDLVNLKGRCRTDDLTGHRRRLDAARREDASDLLPTRALAFGDHRERGTHAFAHHTFPGRVGGTNGAPD